MASSASRSISSAPSSSVSSGRDADAGADHDLGAHDLERLAEPVDDAARPRVVAARLSSIPLHQHRELVASEPRGEVAGTDAVGHPAGHGAEQLVADHVPQAVVHGLEVVEVDEEHADPLSPLGKGVADLGLEEGAVGHPGQGIVEGLVTQLVLQLAKRAEGVLETAVLEGAPGVRREHLEEAQVLAVEGAHLAQPVPDHHQADRAGLAAKDRDHPVADSLHGEELQPVRVRRLRVEDGRARPRPSGR